MSGLTTPSTAVDGNSYQALPPVATNFLTPAGQVDFYWYRFFQSLWKQVASGTNNQVTLQGAHQNATDATVTAGQAMTAVQAETARAEAAEAGLQNQINNINGQISSINGQITTINGTLTSLQSQITTINQRLANAGIP